MLRKILPTGMLVFGLLMPVASQAQEAMSFTLGRLDSAPACGARCAQFIVASGKITHATAFGYFYARKLAGDRDLPVILESPGGVVVSATFLASKWRELGVTVIVAKAEATCRWGGAGRACDPRDSEGKVRTFRLVRGAECASACPLLLAGGVRRLAMSDAKFGVHRPAIDPNSTLGQLAIRLGADDEDKANRDRDDLPAHFSAMGVDPALGRRYLDTAHDGMDWFGLEEARRFTLINAQPADLKNQPTLPAGLLSQIR